MGAVLEDPQVSPVAKATRAKLARTNGKQIAEAHVEIGGRQAERSPNGPAIERALRPEPERCAVTVEGDSR